MNKRNHELNREIEILEDRIKDLINQLDPIDEQIEMDLREYFRIDSIIRLGEFWSNLQKEHRDDLTFKEVWIGSVDEWEVQHKEGGHVEIENQFQGFVDNLKERFQISGKEELTI